MVIKESKTGQIYNISTPTREVGNVKLLCPVCSKSHTIGKQSNKDLSWSQDKKIGNCHRCGSAFYKHTLRSEIKKIYVKPVWKNTTVLDDKIIKYLEGRKISQATIRWNNLVSSGIEFFAGREKLIMQFNYWRNLELINVKYRDAEKHFKMYKDAELIFYNLDSLKDQSMAIITEGEIDCLSLLEVGFKPVVSVPNGAGASLEFMENCIDDFSGTEKVILATIGLIM